MLKLLKWTAIVALLIALFVIVRILSYAQEDNEHKVSAKQAYLQQVAALANARNAPEASHNSDAPNIVLVLFDDLGFGDLSSYGSRAIATPHIDSLAAAGLGFSNYYSPSAVCTPSRAGLLTGRYPPRAGLSTVAFPSHSPMDTVFRLLGGHIRLPFEEILLPEVLQANGYQTAMVGKWHLGDHARSLPNQMGFDYWYGSPYSNDMTPFSIFRNEDLLVDNLQDQSTLNDDYVAEAVGFIERAEDTPFFLYYAHNFPHIPLFSSAEQAGQSNAGLYGDVVEDLDSGVGKIVQALLSKGVLDNTLIIVTSDNGPWYQGDAGPNRGRKGKTFDGGMNVPFITHWPNKIVASGKQAEKSKALLSGVDVFPSILSLLGVALPDDRIIDGKNRLAEMLGERAEADDRYVYYFNGGTLQALRNNRFKYQDAKPYNVGQLEMVSVPKGPFLFDLAADEKEAYDTSMRNTDAFAEMQKQFAKKVADMNNNPRGWR